MDAHSLVTDNKLICPKYFVLHVIQIISVKELLVKEVIIKNKTYLTMITFHPAYLLRQADQKKYSWADLKEARRKIDKFRVKLIALLSHRTG